MDYEDQRNAQIRAEFARRRRNRLIMVIPAIAAAFVALESRRNHAFYGIPVQALVPTMIVVVILAVGFSLYNWRCPACSRYLGRTINPKFCLRCGAQLRD
jgi:hypothetical protein